MDKEGFQEAIETQAAQASQAKTELTTLDAWTLRSLLGILIKEKAVFHGLLRQHYTRFVNSVNSPTTPEANLPPDYVAESVAERLEELDRLHKALETPEVMEFLQGRQAIIEQFMPSFKKKG